MKSRQHHVVDIFRTDLDLPRNSTQKLCIELPILGTTAKTIMYIILTQSKNVQCKWNLNPSN